VVVFVLRRLVRIVFSLVAVSMITFTLLQLAPGNFADISRLTSGGSAIGGGASVEAATSQFTSRYGNQVPPWEQYLKFMKGVVTLDMGPSYKYPNQTVQHIISTAFPISAGLALCAIALALLIAVPLGVVAALKRNTKWDYGTMFSVTALHSLPSYLLALMLILLFSLTVHIFPTSGWTGPKDAVLPILALGLSSAAVLARYVRASMIETLREEYITAAYAKGGNPRVVLIRHALRNSLIPLVTVTGPMLAILMTGTVFVETIFQIPGLGQYFGFAAQARDMPLLMGCTLFFAAILMLMNLLVDIAYGLLDPRIRFGEGGWATWRGPRRRRRALRPAMLTP
jgi:peptide/nickel transport system permease protein